MTQDDFFLAVTVASFFAFVSSYIYCLYLKGKSVSTNAKIIDIKKKRVDSSNHEEHNGASNKYEANIEYETLDKVKIEATLPIYKKYTAKEYQEELPIRYYPETPQSPKINDALTTFKWPIVLGILSICLGILLLA